MSIEGGPRKPIHLKGEVGKIYQEIKRNHGVELSYKERQFLAEAHGAVSYLITLTIKMNYLQSIMVNG